jgi:hypothetical protein
MPADRLVVSEILSKPSAACKVAEDTDFTISLEGVRLGNVLWFEEKTGSGCDLQSGQ